MSVGPQYINRIQNKLEFKEQFKVIGSGLYGTAYIHPEKPNLVFKVTSDKQEVNISKHTKNKKCKHLARIFDIYRLVVNGQKLFVWLIVKERITLLSGIENTAIVNVWKNSRFFVDEHPMNLAEFFKKHPNFKNDKYTYDAIIKLEDMYRSIMKDLNIFVWDLHPENIGYRKNDTSYFVAFDYKSTDYNYDEELYMDI